MTESEEGVKRTVTMFSDVINRLLSEFDGDGVIDDLETKLLCVNKMKFKVKANNVVVSVDNVDKKC